MREPQSTIEQTPAPGLAAARSTRGLVRYLRKRKRLIRDRARTVAATLLVLLLGFAAWWYYGQQRLGRIILTNQGQPLLVEVLPESGDATLEEPFDVVARKTLDLPAGDYRLRVNAVGRLGRTYRFAVNRGETIAHQLSLEEGRLLGADVNIPGSNGGGTREEQIPFAMITTALELTPGRFDLVELTGRGVIRRDSVTGKPVWDTANPKSPFAASRDPGPWLGHFGDNRWQLHVVEPGFDSDGDGTRDVLLVSGGNENSCIALSGADGSMLWNFVAARDGPGGPLSESRASPGKPKPDDPRGAMIGWPSIGDVDRDGTPDLIATLVLHETAAQVQKRTGKPSTPMTPFLSRRVVLAISGRTGRELWSSRLDPAYTEIKTPYWDRPAEVLRGRHLTWVTILEGSQIISLDPATGQRRPSPLDLGFEPAPGSVRRLAGRWRARDPRARAEFLAQPAIAHHVEHELSQATLDHFDPRALPPAPRERTFGMALAR